MRLHHSRGISLIEVLVCTAVAGVLIGAGLPAFANLTRDNHRDGLIQAFSKTALMAREAALGEASAVVVCASTDGILCSADNRDWRERWVLFIDRNGDGILDPDEVRLPAADKPTLDDNFRIEGSAPRLHYRADGSATTGFSLLICDGRGREESRRVQISRVGRATISNAPPECG